MLSDTFVIWSIEKVYVVELSGLKVELKYKPSKYEFVSKSSVLFIFSKGSFIDFTTSLLLDEFKINSLMENEF